MLKLFVPVVIFVFLTSYAKLKENSHSNRATAPSIYLSVVIQSTDHGQAAGLRPWQQKAHYRVCKDGGSYGRPPQIQGIDNVRPPQIQGIDNGRPPQIQNIDNVRPPQIQGIDNVRPPKIQGIDNVRPSQIQGSARLLRSSGRLRRLESVWDDQEIAV